MVTFAPPYDPNAPQQPQPMFPGGAMQGLGNMWRGLGQSPVGQGFQGIGRRLNPISNQLLLGGMGMLSGGTGGAMKGLIAGKVLDKESADERRLRKALSALSQEDSGLLPESPALRGLMEESPEFAQDVLLQQLKPADTPGSYDEWSLAQRNPAYAEFLKSRPAGTSITMAGEKAYEKKVGEGFAEDYLSMQQGARDASSMIGKLDRLGSALSAPGVYTGTGGEFVADLKKTAAGLGMSVEGTESTDVARSISNEITLQLRNPAGGAGMPGAMSDADRQFLSAIPPGLSNTPEGNRQKLDMLKKVQQRNIDVAQFANRYVQENPSGQLDAGFYQALAEWADENPLFPEGDTPAELQTLKQKYGLE